MPPPSTVAKAIFAHLAETETDPRVRVALGLPPLPEPVKDPAATRYAALFLSAYVALVLFGALRKAKARRRSS